MGCTLCKVEFLLIVAWNDVGTSTMWIDTTWTDDGQSHIVPSEGQLWFIANDDVVVHGERDVIDDELQGGTFVDPHETTSGPGGRTAGNHFTDNLNRVPNAPRVLCFIAQPVVRRDEESWTDVVTPSAIDVRTAVALT